MTHRDFPNIKFHRAGHMVHIARAMIASILKRTIFSLRFIFDIRSAFFPYRSILFRMGRVFAYRISQVVSSPIAFSEYLIFNLPAIILHTIHRCEFSFLSSLFFFLNFTLAFPFQLRSPLCCGCSLLRYIDRMHRTEGIYY